MTKGKAKQEGESNRNPLKEFAEALLAPIVARCYNLMESQYDPEERLP